MIYIAHEAFKPSFEMIWRDLLIFAVVNALGSWPLVAAGEPPSNGPIATGPNSEAVRCVNLPVTKAGETRNLLVARTRDKLVSAVLVLCPDGDQDAKTILVDRAWQNFAEDHKLGLAAVTIAGKVADKQLHPVSSLTPTAVVLEAIDHEYGGGIPLILYGWPQQADFTAGLLAANAQRVRGWCLRAPNRLPVLGSTMPPGIVICQKEDKPRYDALMQDFIAGRKKGERLTWIALSGEKPTGSNLPALDAFTRSYFAWEFTYKPGLEQWSNIDTKQSVRILDASSQSNLTSYLPHPALASAWAALHVPGGPTVAQQTIIEREEDTRNSAQPKLHLYLRRPTGSSTTEGVLAYCTWDSDRTKIINRLQDEHYFLVRYAEAHHLALLTWSTAIAFANGESADERSQQENFKDNSGFNQLADTWERGVHVLCHEAGLPETDFLLYGLSAGAQWAHRLALRKPSHFLAVNIHVNSSYDWPTPEAKNILWLQTTGDREYGYPAALRFYSRCQEMGYPIIFKAGENLGHGSSSQIEEIAWQFFDYALEVKAKRNESIARAYHTPNHKVAKLDMYTLSGLAQAPYYADLINQEVYGANQKEMIPASQRVPLPTKALAQAWGEIVDEPNLRLVSNAKVVPPVIKPSPTSSSASEASGRLVSSIEPTPANRDDFVGKLQLSLRRSIAEYPELTQAGSVPNATFVSTYQKLENAKSSILDDPTWPEQVTHIMREHMAAHPDYQLEFQASLQRAIISYPALADADSPVNTAFLAEYHRLKDAGSDLLADPTWPEQVARTVGGKVE